MCFLFSVSDILGGRCRYSYTRCSLEDSVKEIFPLTTDPTYKILKRSDNRPGAPMIIEVPQLADYVDNDVSDFSWDKVFWFGESILKLKGNATHKQKIITEKDFERIINGKGRSPVLWYDTADVSNWHEDSRFVNFDPENGIFKVSNSSGWVYGPDPSGRPNFDHGKNATLYVIIKTKTWKRPYPLGWVRGDELKGKTYLAGRIQDWRRNPPNWPVTGGPGRVEGDDIKFIWPGMAGRMLDALGFNHEMRIPPLEGFIPQGGETVGFMLTGFWDLNRGHDTHMGLSRNGRTNIVWYRLPSRQGKGNIKGKILGCYSDKHSPCVSGGTGTTFSKRDTASGSTQNRINEGTVVGVCGTYRGESDASCSSGAFHLHPGHNDNQYRWTCRNIPHTTGETRCRQSKAILPIVAEKPIPPLEPVVATCGSYQGESDASCAEGKFHRHPGHSDNQYRWTCRNIPHTSGETRCRQSKRTPPIVVEKPIPPLETVVATCGFYQGESDASCTAGKFHNHPGHSDNQYRWTCRNIPHNGEEKCNEFKISSQDRLRDIYGSGKRTDEIEKAYKTLEDIGEKLSIQEESQ